MEFGTIIRIRLINIKSTNKINPRLIYYIVSVISRIFLFFIIILYLSSIRFIKTDIFNFIVQIIFFLKIGTFPYYYYYYYKILATSRENCSREGGGDTKCGEKLGGVGREGKKRKKLGDRITGIRRY